MAVIGHAKLHGEGTVVEDDSLGAGPAKAHRLFRTQRLGPARSWASASSGRGSARLPDSPA